jgi:hypothetical protein
VAGSAGIPDDVGSGACQDFTPCGGDVVGSWSIDICSDPPLQGLKALCPAAEETVTASGTAQLRPDGSMTSTLRLVFDTVLPASCVAQLGTCGAPGQGLNFLEDCQPGPAGSCACQSLGENGPSEASYTTSQEALLTVIREGEPSYSYYCRQGDELWARGVDETNGAISVLHFSKL